jgi:hypothetical protein
MDGDIRVDEFILGSPDKQGKQEEAMIARKRRQ